MTYLSLRQWSGQLDNPKVIARIRRTITGRLAGGQCVCVLDDGAEGLTSSVKEEISRGWPQTKVRFSHTHPSAKPMTPARRRRQPPASK